MPNLREEVVPPRKPIIIGKQGRVVIPKRFREALGLPEGEEYPLWIEVYIGPENHKALMITK
jgi:bifunctional DNA-binding transcriptional regulator/antitoxin component of YhaV-PrlF toxin-antitoxin module